MFGIYNMSILHWRECDFSGSLLSRVLWHLQSWLLELWPMNIFYQHAVYFCIPLAVLQRIGILKVVKSRLALILLFIWTFGFVSRIYLPMPRSMVFFSSYSCLARQVTCHLSRLHPTLEGLDLSPGSASWPASC